MFFVFPRVVRPDVCNQIVIDCKQNILKDAKIDGLNKKGRDDLDIRKTSVHFIKDEAHKANKLAWHYLREANKVQFHYDLTFFQAIQFAEYKDGGFYDWHQDASGIDPNNETRKLSLSLILSDPDTFEGGELQFFNGGRPMEDQEDITAEQLQQDLQAQGTIVVFDSSDFHRVTPVNQGVRHSIVCWTVGPNFK